MGVGLSARITHWTNRLVALLRLTPLRLNCVIVSSQKALVLQRVYVIDDGQRFVANKHHPFYIAVTQRRLILLTQRKLTCVNIETRSGDAAVPNLGVTCPLFFRCEAPRFYSSPYSSACASHVWITSGACQARRNRFRIDCQCSIGNRKAIPFSRAKKNTPLCSFSTIAVCA